MVWLVLIALVWVAVGACIFHSRRKRRNRCTAQIGGTVVRVVVEDRMSTDSDTGEVTVSTYHCPVYEYIVDGKNYSYKSKTDITSAKFAVGQPVTVFYDPNDPAYCLIAEEHSKAGSVFSVIVFVLELAGIIYTIIYELR